MNSYRENFHSVQKNVYGEFKPSWLLNGLTYPLQMPVVKPYFDKAVMLWLT